MGKKRKSKHVIADDATASRQQVLGDNAIVALLYLLASLLTEILVNDFGYSAPLWPPVGIALAWVLIKGYAILPGLFIAALIARIVNESMVYGSDALHSVWLLGAFAIAIATTLQAAIARCLITQVITLPTRVETLREWSLLSLIGGPLACLVTSAIGAAVLFADGTVDRGQVAETWFEWWLADSLGVLLIAPVLLVLFGPCQDGRPTRLRRIIVSLPVIGVVGMLMLAYHYAKTWEAEDHKVRFLESANLRADLIRETVERYSTGLHSIAHYSASHRDLSEATFAAFAHKHLQGNDGIVAVEWHETNPSASDRRYLAAIDDNHQSVQDVLSANQPIDALIEQAIDTHGIALSDSYQLRENENVFFKALPVFNAGTASDQLLQGVLIGLYSVTSLIEHALQPVVNRSINLHVYHEQEQGTPLTAHGIPIANAPLQHRVDVQIGDRQFWLEFTPQPRTHFLGNGPVSWLVLASGSLFCMAVQAVLLLVSAQNDRSQREVIHHAKRSDYNQGMMRAIVESAVDGLLTIDKTGIIQSFNPACVHMFGYQPHEVIGQNVSMLMTDSDAAKHDQYLAKYTDDSRRGMVGQQRELTARRKDGSEFPIFIAASELDFGDDLSFCAVLRDITEKRRLERMTDSFVSTVNHELRTPLTSVKGALSLLRSSNGDGLNARAKRLIDLSYGNCLRLENLVNDMLDMRKITAGKMQYRLDRYDLVPLIKQTVESMSIYARTHDAGLVVDLPDSLYCVVDPLRFEQALSNLLSNAAKFTAPHSEVMVKLTQDNAMAVLSVVDQGPGIPESFRDQVFEKFSQADTSNTRTRGG
ncbi:PAS domain S-box protein, partial [Gammaproteobacteria bacterium]|nr:PAS domain S-box protein [Gammaproteobacteria bacterium]